MVYLNIKPHHDAENRAVKKMFDGAGITLEAFDDLEAPDADVIKDLLKVKAERYS